MMTCVNLSSIFHSQVVYWDMRSAWCEHLYRHRVIGSAPFSSNIDPLLEALNQVRVAQQAGHSC